MLGGGVPPGDRRLVNDRLGPVQTAGEPVDDGSGSREAARGGCGDVSSGLPRMQGVGDLIVIGSIQYPVVDLGAEKGAHAHGEWRS